MTPARAGGRGPLLSTLPGVSSPLIQASQSARPLGSPSIAGWAVSGISTSHPSPGSEPATYQSTLGAHRSEAELLNSDAECLPPSVSWLPLANSDRSILDVDIFQASQQVLSHRLAVPKLIFDNFETAHDDDDTPQHGQSPGPWSHPAESRVQFPERPASGIDEQIALLPVDQSPLNKKLLRLCKWTQPLICQSHDPDMRLQTSPFSLDSKPLSMATRAPTILLYVITPPSAFKIL